MQNRSLCAHDIEILAPVGSYESLHGAFKAGADSVYFGVCQLNMRARSANNFDINDLAKIVSLAKKHHIKTYLTVNTIMYDHDLLLMRKICNHAKKSGINAIIASDIAAIQYCHSKNIPVHISTQLNVSNIEAVRFFSAFADTIVLARELTLPLISSICSQIKKDKILGPSGNPVQIELFAHGALCVSISGKCYMSLSAYNASANRGACFQNCRRSYRVIDEETGEELRLENKYVMSPKDLCTIGFLDQLIHSGIRILKIEGRGRSPEYVYTVTKAYKEAIQSIYNGTYTKQKIQVLLKQLQTVYNRGFWQGGYYLGKKLEQWSGTSGSKATHIKKYIGKGVHYFSNIKIAQFLLEDHSLKKGDTILVTGKTTGVIYSTIETLKVNNKSINRAKRGDMITIPLQDKIRKNDRLFLVSPRT